MRLRFIPLALLGTFVLGSGCKKVCNTDNLPRYSLTAGFRAWSTPYPNGAVLRFRNASTGYVRSYRVSKAESATQDVGSGRNLCPQYQQEYTSHALERSDSTGGSENKVLRVDVLATSAERCNSTVHIGSTLFGVPLSEIEAGTQALFPATFAGRNYPAVYGCVADFAYSGANVTVKLYLTKADGIVRFEERGGTVWERL